MPQTFKGRATFPGVKQIVEGTVTLSHGISPSSFHLTIAPQIISNQYTVGNLDLYYENIHLTFRDCKINVATLQRNSSGMVIAVELFDRRWKWAWGTISGWYNVRQPPTTGKVKISTVKSPAALARLCLDEMKEARYDVSPLSATTYEDIEIDWDGVTPAQALADLAEHLGCRVTLTVDDRVAVVKVGEGNSLPKKSLLEGSISADLPESPSELAVRCGKTRFQADLELEAVGQDTDGTICPISGLSYIPSGGWDNSDVLTGFACLATEHLQELAKRSVFRWYRVKVPFDIPGWDGEVEDLDYIALESEQVDTAEILGHKVNRPAQVWGTWCRGTDSLDNVVAHAAPPIGENANLHTSGYYRPFSLNADRASPYYGIVQFEDPIFRNLNNAEPLRYGTATLHLRTALTVRNKEGKWVHHIVTRTLDNRGNTPTRYLKHDELVTTVAGGVVRNKEEIKTACEYYLDAARDEYKASSPETMKYPGLVQLDLDGAIQQITWHVGTSGAWTQASRNTENLQYVLPYRERRFIERLKPLAWAMKAGIGTADGSRLKSS